ncbi:hypothetical protein QYM36_005852 [Artemia franciscana]|uniref:peptidylglycine monooxygenase n=1 Tax=Artemia franciscana TaxID=6661 RepID=A0AA88L6D8_ARTSF|nr:hypothetical protein QYM36_005852 [Artemia franciscana]
MAAKKSRAEINFIRLMDATTNAISNEDAKKSFGNKLRKPETYFCTPIRIDSKKDYYITGFKPNATSLTAHHMLIYGCEAPGSKQPVWNCGEMARANKGLKSGPPCSKGSQIIYAWAHDAPALELPEGVAFKVGGDTSIQYLVLQVHYASVERFKNGVTDDSGIILDYTEEAQPKAAGVLLMGTGGRIKANSIEYMETSCTINENKVIHPFAFRTHTHALGRVVSGYKVTRNKGVDNWELIGKKDPQLPQMFYPVEDKAMTIGKGDTLAARCTMVSNRSWTTKVGGTSDDEMCNFYLMYWTQGKELKKKTCFSFGPPLYSWRGLGGLRNIPDDASTL